MLLEYGEKTHLIKSVIKFERQVLSSKILINRVRTGRWRCDTDETKYLFTNCGNDVNIPAIQLVLQFSIRVF
jgi:hypothetical protein